MRLVVFGFVRAKWIMRIASVVVFPDWRGKTTTIRFLVSLRSSVWYGVGWKLNHSAANFAGSEGTPPQLGRIEEGGYVVVPVGALSCLA